MELRGGFGMEKLRGRSVVDKYFYLRSERRQHPELFKLHTWNRKHSESLRGEKHCIYFTFSKSSQGAVNLAAQKQLSESRGMRGEGDRGWREKRDEESETQRQFGLIMLIFPSSAKQKHPGTFRHTTGDQSLLSFSFSPHRVSLQAKSNISLFTAGACLPIAPFSLYISYGIKLDSFVGTIIGSDEDTLLKSG